MTAMILTALLPAVLLAGGFLIWLRRAGYGGTTAVALSTLALAQAGTVVAIAERGHSLWLAVGIGAMAASASSFAEREDARGIILVGSSLAAIQLCDPMGGLVAAGLLPATLAMGRGREDSRKAVGLYALVLFLPVMMALLLLYLSGERHIDMARLLAGSPPLASRADAGSRFSVALGLVIVLAPLLVDLCRRSAGRPALLVAIAVMASAVLDGIFGVIREPVTLVAVAAPLTVVALASSPVSPGRGRRALLAAGLCAGLSWAVLFWFLPVLIVRL